MGKKALIYSLLVAPLFAACLLSIHLGLEIFVFGYNGEDKSFEVKNGEGFSSINYRLQKEEFINNARIFHYYAKFTDQMHRFKAGSYIIPKGSTMETIVELLVSGNGQTISVTIPEGKNMYEVADILVQAGVVKSKERFLKIARTKKYIKLATREAAPSVEGYLFPETYKFSPKAPEEVVIKAMIHVFKEKTKALDFSVSSLSPQQIITLASIVEKETGAKWERPTIAGVYLNRLRKRMRLQADPTTIYGIWEKYNGNLRKKHLLEKTAYNTYKMAGLPLGPIANPGLAAIKAVLQPKKHNNLYFVSKNDGTHVFTPTYKEHLKAVRYWQQNASNRKGKSWRDLKQ